MNTKSSKSVAIIVAHPDDETLWAGGTILTHLTWKCFIICLCRKSDEDRAKKFYEVLKVFHADGDMGDLDDGSDQNPLESNEVKSTILRLLPQNHFDLVITHSPQGEYTKHLRHEETSKAVISLWEEGKLKTSKLWIFGYEDGNKSYFPIAIRSMPIYKVLETVTWQKKYQLITDLYGFKPESWEAQTTPKAEAFWEFEKAEDVAKWVKTISK